MGKRERAKKRVNLRWSLLRFACIVLTINLDIKSANEASLRLFSGKLRYSLHL